MKVNVDGRQIYRYTLDEKEVKLLRKHYVLQAMKDSFYRHKKSSSRRSVTRRAEQLFSNTKYGRACKIMFRAVYRHCNRYAKAFNVVMVQDSIQETAAELLQERIDLSTSSMDAELAVKISRMSVNAYNRELNRVNKAQETLTCILDETEEQITYKPVTIGQPGKSLLKTELQQAIAACIQPDPVEHTIIRRLVAGYSQKQIAEELRKGVSTIRRRTKEIGTKELRRVLEQSIAEQAQSRTYNRRKKKGSSFYHYHAEQEQPVRTYKLTQEELQELQLKQQPIKGDVSTCLLDAPLLPPKYIPH